MAREGSEKSFSSDDSMSPASTIIKTVSKSCKGRSKYTKEEDMAMIKFLVTERRYLEATGMRVWRDMQMLEVLHIFGYKGWVGGDFPFQNYHIYQGSKSTVASSKVAT